MQLKKHTLKIILTTIMTFCLFSCTGQNSNIPAAVTDAEPIHINRFDKDLYQLINTGDTSLIVGLNQKYPKMLELLGKGVLNMKSTSLPGYWNKLINFYSEPTLKKLYANAIQKYNQVQNIEIALGNGFAWLKICLPKITIPQVYMHISGFNQNVLVSDNTLSLSIDKYMGADYPLYQEFFYEPQRSTMIPERIIPDYLTGWIMSEYPFVGKENVLLDRMLYEGKLKYLIQHAYPELSAELLMSYTNTELTWCKENESDIWKLVIERKHLYTPDQITTSKYFEIMPNNSLINNAPGNIGTWIGWQIITKYMNETNSTIEALMNNNDSQEILTASKYKP